MHRMTFFDEAEDAIDDRLANFDYVPGTPQAVSFESQPAISPVHVEAVSVLLMAINYKVDAFDGYLGKIRVTLEYDGRTYPLAYAAFPRALEVRTDQVIHAPELICDRQEGLGYALSYTLPLARNQVFLMHPGMSATLHVAREITSASVLKTNMRVLVAAELNGDLGVVSQRKRLLSRELNAYEKALIDV